MLLLGAVIAGCERAQPVSLSGQYAYEISLATFGDHLGVAWHGGSRSRDAIYLRFADSRGTATGIPLRLSDQTREAYEPDLQSLDGDPLVAWYEKDRRDGSLTALLARFNQRGELQWRRELSGAGSSGRNPVVRIANHEIAVAWIETPAAGDPAIWAARLDRNGELSAPARQLASASQETWNLNAAIDDAGTLYVVYDARLGTRAKELRLATMGRNDVAEHLLSTDDGYDSSYPDLALDGERAAITWFDARDGNTEIYLFAGQIGDLSTAVDARATRVTDTLEPSIGAYLAWNGARIGLAWCDTRDGQFEIFSQLFNEQGMALQAARQLTRTSAQSLIPAIRPWRSGFAIAWNEYLPGTADPSGHGSTLGSTAMLELIP